MFIATRQPHLCDICITSLVYRVYHLVLYTSRLSSYSLVLTLLTPFCGGAISTHGVSHGELRLTSGCDDIAFFLYFYSYYSYSALFRSVLLHSTPLPIPNSPISLIAVAHRALWLCHA